MNGRTVRYVLTAAVLLAIGVPAVAAAFGEGTVLRLGKRNPANASGAGAARETQVIADNTTYGTRQSNKRDGDGGGAIYGCRSAAGNEPCIRASNLNNGRAFEFNTNGKEAGRITVKDTAGAPFTTNARGVATGLNADEVDGKQASDFAAAGDLAWAAVAAADGRLTANRGATTARLAEPANGTYAVTFAREVAACSFSATAAGGSANGDVAFAVTPSTTDPKTVLVDQTDDVTDRADFHLQVVC